MNQTQKNGDAWIQLASSFTAHTPMEETASLALPLVIPFLLNLRHQSHPQVG